jgi:hypothetical protein
MRAKLKFNLDLPEDRQAHLRCVKATDMAIVIADLYKVKKMIEDRLDFGAPDSSYELLDEVFKEINDLVEQQGINIDELIS